MCWSTCLNWNISYNNNTNNVAIRRIGLARKRISFLRAQLLKKKDVMVSLMIKSSLTEDEAEVKHTNNEQQRDQQHDDSPTLDKLDPLHKHRGKQCSQGIT